MDLSVVIPVFNGEQFILNTLTRLNEFLQKRIRSFEIIVVDDGSSDQTLDRIKSFTNQNLRVLSSPANQGKFAALVAGMAHSHGRCRVFTDSDLPYELEAIPYIVNLINERGFHVVVGDRTLRSSEYRTHLPLLRRVATRWFSRLVTVFVTGGLFDTQCGLKGLRADVADALFPLLQDRGFSGDVELLYVALKYNLEIKRIPVRLRGSSPSAVRVVPHALRMLLRISKLRGSWSRGLYHSEALLRISDQSYWEVPSRGV